MRRQRIFLLINCLHSLDLSCVKLGLGKHRVSSLGLRLSVLGVILLEFVGSNLGLRCPDKSYRAMKT